MYILYTVGLESLIEKHGVRMHLFVDDNQLYDHSHVNNLYQSIATLEACLEDIHCVPIELIPFVLALNQSILKIIQKKFTGH